MPGSDSAATGSPAGGTPGRRARRGRAPRACAWRSRVAVRPRVRRYTGHDPARVEQVRGVGRLELRALEDDAEAAVPDLPRQEQHVARADPPLDVPPPEPGRLGRARLVGQLGGRDLDVPPPRLLDVDGGHPGPGRDDRAVRDPVQVVQRPELAQVVVAAGQVEQEVPHRLEAQVPAGPPQDRGRPEAGLPQPEAEPRDGIVRDRRRAASARSERLPRAGAVRLRSLTRRRSGTGSAAGRRA